MVLENKANFCPEELPVDQLKEIASVSGMNCRTTQDKKLTCHATPSSFCVLCLTSNCDTEVSVACSRCSDGGEWCEENCYWSD